jgi:hypothetical protein
MDRITSKIEKAKAFIEKTGVIFLSILIVSFTTMYIKYDIFWGLGLGVALFLSMLFAGLGYIYDTFRCVMLISIVSKVNNIVKF